MEISESDKAYSQPQRRRMKESSVKFHSQRDCLTCLLLFSDYTCEEKRIKIDDFAWGDRGCERSQLIDRSSFLMHLKIRENVVPPSLQITYGFNIVFNL